MKIQISWKKNLHDDPKGVLEEKNYALNLCIRARSGDVFLYESEAGGSQFEISLGSTAPCWGDNSGKKYFFSNEYTVRIWKENKRNKNGNNKTKHK